MPKRLTLKDVQNLAEKKGGICLSTEYKGANTKLRWRCTKGHEWETVPNSIKRGTWCLECAGKRTKTIEQMHQFAKQRGGECLSIEYKNQNSLLKWKCGKCNHEWKASPSNITNNNSWCPKCSGNLPPTLEEIKKLAQERAGECLSTSYSRNNHKLSWKCYCGNKWNANWNNVKSGSWCPKCQVGLGERICRIYFETLFGVAFPTVHPDWLPASSGRNYELDGYNEQIGIAFEHQGRHHYEILGFGVGKDMAKLKFQEVKRRDKIKSEICKKKGIVLIAIPEVPYILPIEEIPNLIKTKCKESRIKLPRNFDKINVDIKPAFTSYRALNRLNKIREIAKQNGGQCLSEYYANSSTPLLFRCSKGHRWEAKPDSIINKKSWCGECSRNRKLSIENAQGLARKNGGICLSTKYINSKTNLKWKCGKCNFVWEAHYNRIYNGNWCPECWKQRRKFIKKRESK